MPVLVREERKTGMIEESSPPVLRHIRYFDAHKGVPAETSEADARSV